MEEAAKLVDIAKYPIFAAEDPAAQRFYEASRKIYEQQGVLALAGFILPKAVAQMADEAAEVEPKSFKQVKHHNVYLASDDRQYPADHPRNRQLTTTNSTIADADIQANATLRAIYHCRELHKFIAHVTGKSGIYPYEDALSPLNIGVSRPGETLAWHFDTSEFATTLLLQAPENGGEFEYIPRTRSDDDPAYQRVGRLLDGDLSEVKTLAIEPGTLVLFQGRHSIHRVTPVKGNRTRLLAILTYDEKPGQRMNEFTQKKFYGRAA